MRTGRISDKEWSDLDRGDGQAARHADLHRRSGALTALEVRARARRLKREFSKLGLVVIDYLQADGGIIPRREPATESRKSPAR